MAGGGRFLYDAWPSRRPKPSPATAAFFDLLRREWKGLESLQPETREDIQAHLDRLQPEDLGVSAKDARRMADRGAKVGYQDVFAGEELTLAVFILAAGARIPLHDHPDMDVFGRLLFGRMRVVSYDPETLGEVPPLPNGRMPPRGSRFCRRGADRTLGPEPTTFSLGPKEGNIHELHAIDDCAFFDVVMPPYDEHQGRDCTYYAVVKDALEAEEEAEGRCLLVPTHYRDFSTAMLDYVGPPFRPPHSRS